jgi:hypothetical protein
MSNSILEQLEKVRRTGQVDLYNLSGISITAEHMGFDELAIYVNNCSIDECLKTLETYFKWLKELPPNECDSKVVSIKALAAGGLTLTWRQHESAGWFATTPIGQWGPFDTAEQGATIAIKALCDRVAAIEAERES